MPGPDLPADISTSTSSVVAGHIKCWCQSLFAAARPILTPLRQYIDCGLESALQQSSGGRAQVCRNTITSTYLNYVVLEVCIIDIAVRTIPIVLKNGHKRIMAMLAYAHISIK